MSRRQVKSFIVIGCMIVLTCVAISYSKQVKKISNPLTEPVTVSNNKSLDNGVIALNGKLVQDKIYSAGDGLISMSLIISADKNMIKKDEKKRNMDMVVVIDKSGSMSGAKIQNAKKAVSNLINDLTSDDRFALVTYSDSAVYRSGLVPVSESNRENLHSIVASINTDGSTNLGDGLSKGIGLLTTGGQKNGNLGKVILISDGLANRGITNLNELANIASAATEKSFAISSVGVGTDFNEELMTAIADRGAGNYYFLETPDSFARMFQKEFSNTRAVAANGVSIHIPLKDGVSVVKASGYPVKIQNNEAVFYPGDILSGQTREIFVTLRVPTDKLKNYKIDGINVRYLANDIPFTASLKTSFTIACVEDEKAVYSSLDKKVWEKQVLQDSYNELKENVSRDIKAGKKEEAKRKIENYRNKQQMINAHVQSEAVDENLADALPSLEKVVDDSFTGTEREKQVRQKKNSKSLQHDGYWKRRSK